MGPTPSLAVRPSRESEEARRVAALRAYRILDTPPEQTFDDIVRVAAHIFGASRAAVSLVDLERQWFKARVNLDAEETDLSRSFCVNAVRGKCTLVVDDASRHPEFATYPNVVGEDKLRFYVGAPLIDSEGVALGTVCVFDSQTRHITPEKIAALEALAREATARLELRKAAHALAESARARKELLDLLAHEINGAVAPVVMCAELLATDDSRVPPETAELLGVVQRNIGRAGHLARDILELARIEGDRLKVDAREVDARELLGQAAGAMRAMADAAGVAIEIAPGGPVRARADGGRILQVLTNLLSNAIKFTPAGGRITLAAELDGADAVISATDTGQGMTPDQAAGLFQAFSQAGHLAGDNDPGNGLGLFICRQLVEAHGGRIWSESRGAGHGTAMRFTLPAA